MGANIGEASVVMVRRENSMDLPPGFRFHPTDEEIISHYLVNKVVDPGFTARAIGDVDLNKFEPWQLPSQAKMGEKELYFFCHRDRKYPTGMRTNRATEEGYWKATGKDKEIYSKGKEKHLVGMKKTLVFYKGRAPKGEKSNWVTHEYRLEGKSTYWNLPKTAKDEWVVCRIFHKTTGLRRETLQTTPEGYPMMNNPPPLLTPPPHVGGGFMDSTTPPLPPLMEAPYVVPHRDNNLYPNSYHQPVMMNSAYSSTHPSISSWFNPQQFMPQQHQSYLHQFNRSAPVAPQLALTQCKAEQHYSSSQQLVASPEAGESADRNTDVSSMSRQENNIGAGSSGRSAFEGFDDDPVSASGQGMDMWASF